MGDYSELKRLADRVISDRRFCGDENHKALAEGVMALITENERLKKFEEWFGRLETCNNSLAESFRAERDQLKAENEALRKDAERYRWLRNACGIVEYKKISGSIGPGMLPSGEKLEAAIDAAMGKGERS